MFKKVKYGSGEVYITNNDIKNKVIDFLYSKVDISKHNFNVLNNINKLKYLQHNEHYVSPNYNGYNYLLIFMYIDNKKYCFAVDRKKLTFSKNELDISTLFVYNIKIETNDNIYDGTIFDGKLISASKYIFLIDNCYILGGKKMNNDLEEKLEEIDNIITKNFHNDYCDNFLLKINKLSRYDNLEKLIKSLPILEYKTSGLVFYPKISGSITIFIERKETKVNINTNDNIEEKSYDIISNFVNFLKNRTYSYEKEGKTKILYLNRTLIPDVYNLYDNDEKIGIALIPNLKISQMCDKEVTDKLTKFKCIYSNKFKKYIPIQKL